MMANGRVSLDVCDKFQNLMDNLILKIMDKKIFTILHADFLLIWF